MEESDTGPWKTAPRGGLTWRHNWLAIQIWVPEGWKQDHEPARDPKNPMGWIPIWYPEKDGLGTVRATAIRILSAKDKNWYHMEQARAVLEKRKSQPEKISPQIVIEPQRSIVSFSQSGVEDGPIWTNFWEIYDERGLILVSYTYPSASTVAIDKEKLARELSQVAEIVKRIEHLNVDG